MLFFVFLSDFLGIFATVVISNEQLAISNEQLVMDFMSSLTA